MEVTCRFSGPSHTSPGLNAVSARSFASPVYRVAECVSGISESMGNPLLVYADSLYQANHSSNLQ